MQTLSTTSSRVSPETAGMLLGLLGVAIFSLTLPFTRLAVADLDPTFAAMARAVVAALLAAAWLRWQRAPLPPRTALPGLAAVAAGCVIGFPLLTSMAMRSLHAADLALFAAVLAAAFGYAEGGRLAQTLGGQQVISWALLLALPVALPLTLWQAWDDGAALAAASLPAWLGFGYTCVFSMFLGFFLWYRGMALGGVARVGQVQLVQPFLTLLGAALVLGEPLQAAHVAFALAVIAVVAVGRRTAVRRRLS